MYDVRYVKIMINRRNIILISVLILNYIGVDALVKEDYFGNENATCVEESISTFKQIVAKRYKANINFCDRNTKSKGKGIALYYMIAKDIYDIESGL